MNDLKNAAAIDEFDRHFAISLADEISQRYRTDQFEASSEKEPGIYPPLTRVRLRGHRGDIRDVMRYALDVELTWSREASLRLAVTGEREQARAKGVIVEELPALLRKYGADIEKGRQETKGLIQIKDLDFG